jgi:hypothetical protein
MNFEDGMNHSGCRENTLGDLDDMIFSNGKVSPTNTLETANTMQNSFASLNLSSLFVTDSMDHFHHRSLPVISNTARIATDRDAPWNESHSSMLAGHNNSMRFHSSIRSLHTSHMVSPERAVGTISSLDDLQNSISSLVHNASFAPPLSQIITEENEENTGHDLGESFASLTLTDLHDIDSTAHRGNGRRRPPSPQHDIDSTAHRGNGRRRPPSPQQQASSSSSSWSNFA